MEQPQPQYLSVDGAQGLILAIRSTCWGWLASLDSSTIELYPGQTLDDVAPEQLVQYNPLYAYTRQSTVERGVVNYIYVSKLFDMLERLNQTHHNNSFNREMIGRSWWRGIPPIVQNRSYRYNLQRIVGSKLLSLYDNVDLFAMESPEPLRLRFACRIFAKVLIEDIGIQCQVDARYTTTLLTFPDCPFCANKLSECRVLFGVVKAFILWLYDSSEDDSFTVAHKQILRIQSNGHNHHTIAIEYTSNN